MPRIFESICTWHSKEICQQKLVCAWRAGRERRLSVQRKFLGMGV